MEGACPSYSVLRNVNTKCLLLFWGRIPYIIFRNNSELCQLKSEKKSSSSKLGSRKSLEIFLILDDMKETEAVLQRIYSIYH